MAKLFSKIFAAVLGFIPLHLFASNIDYGNQAIRCSAIYYVLTKVTENNPKLGNYFSDIAQYYGAIYGEERKKIGLSTINRQVFEQRDSVLKQLASQFKTKQSKLLEEANLCLSWTNNIRSSTEQENYRSAYPTQINNELVAQFKLIILDSFTAWVSEGAPIGDEALMNALKNNSSKSK